MRRMVLSGALVEAYFDNLPPEQKTDIRHLHDLIQAAVPTFETTVLWGDLAFMVQGRNLLSIGAHRSHAAVHISNGSSMMVEFPELEGRSKGMRWLRLPYGQAIDAPRVQALVQASYTLARSASAFARTG